MSNILTPGEARGLAQTAFEEERAVAIAERELALAKTELARARASREWWAVKATAMAYESGRIDGKNVEQRKVQLEAFLAEDKRLTEADEEIKALEDVATDREYLLAQAKAQARLAGRLFEIGLACLRSQERVGPVVALGAAS